VGTFSIWHWIIVLVFLGGPVALAVWLGVWLGRRRK
jgi:hypothetical protein